MPHNSPIIGLDIGTSSICAMIGEMNPNNELEILGVGVSPSEGLRNGVIVNIEAAQKVILSAIENAEQMAGIEAESVITNLSGTHITGINSRGVVAVKNSNREITQEDLDRVLEAARAIGSTVDKEIIHVIPQDYIVDGQKGIKDPRNMIGIRLESEVHIIKASITAAQNVIKCVNRAGFKVSELIYEGLAAAKATLTKEEMEIGILFINLGASTTDAILFHRNAPHHSIVHPIGGNYVTSDISILFKIPFDDAERIKISDGFASSIIVKDSNEEFIIPGIAGRSPRKSDRATLCSYIEPRMAEIFTMVKERIERETGFENWEGLGGVVLCGGASMLPGTEELAQAIFKASARVAEPLGVQGLTLEVTQPDRSTAYGLVRYGAELEKDLMEQKSTKMKKTPTRFFSWIRNFF